MPTNTQLKEFAAEIENDIDLTIPTSILETATQWISKNMNPDEIFDIDELRTAVQKGSLPQDVFDDKELGDWAESNGYVKE